jgi:membrane-associated protease RseP (regulator of RpoE activity)
VNLFFRCLSLFLLILHRRRDGRRILAAMVCCILLTGAVLAIVVHELGHYLAARQLGIKIVSFSVGLGPELFGITDRLGTRWRIGVFPLGGSVSLAESRDGDFEPELPCTVSAIPVLQQVLIYSAGPLSSLLLGAALLGAVPVSSGALRFGMDVPTAEVAATLMVAYLSLLIALFNLLPLPPLDGGRLLIVAIEAMRAKPFSKSSKTRISYVGFIIISALSTLSIIYGAKILLTM